MVRAACISGFVLGGLVGMLPLISAQQPASDAPVYLSGLTQSGQVTVGGRSSSYLIRRLPVSSFPELPANVVDVLVEKGCMIPQTYEARRPENVVHASLERAGSSDWAVLCSAQGVVSLLVFFESAPAVPVVLARAAETDRLQNHFGTATLGFNWGIDPASAESVRQALIGSVPHPRLMDHESLADSVIDRNTVYHVYSQGTWSSIKMPE
jgi:hypothetical protein